LWIIQIIFTIDMEMEDGDNHQQVRPYEITDYMFTDFYGEFRRQAKEILSTNKYLKRDGIAAPFFNSMLLSCIVLSSVPVNHRIERAYFDSFYNKKHPLGRDTVLAVVRRSDDEFERLQLEFYSIQIRYIIFDSDRKLELHPHWYDALLEHLERDYPGLVGGKDFTQYGSNALLIGTQKQRVKTVKVPITRGELTEQEIRPYFHVLTPNSQSMNELDFNRFDPNTNPPPRRQGFGENYFTEMCNLRNTFSHYFYSVFHKNVALYVSFHGSLMNWMQKWSFDIDPIYSNGLSLTSDTGLDGMILPRRIRLSTFIKVLNEENDGSDDEISTKLTLAPLKETESTTAQIVELSRHYDPNLGEQVQSNFYVQSLLTQNNDPNEKSLLEYMFSLGYTDSIRNKLMKEVSDSLFVHGRSFKKLAVELLVKFMAVSSENVDTFSVHPRKLHALNLGDNLFLIRNIQEQQALIISVSETPVDYEHLFFCISKMRQKLQITGRKFRTRCILVSEINFDVDGGVAYHAETGKRMVFEVAEPGLTNYGWRNFLPESLFRLVEFSDENPPPTRKDVLDYRNDLITIPSLEFYLPELSFNTEEITYITTDQLDSIIFSLVQLGALNLNTGNSETLALFCHRYLASQLFEIELSPNDPTLLRVRNVLKLRGDNLVMPEDAQFFWRKVTLLEADPTARQENNVPQAQEQPMDPAGEEDHTSRHLSFFKKENGSYSYISCALQV